MSFPESNCLSYGFPQQRLNLGQSLDWWGLFLLQPLLRDAIRTMHMSILSQRDPGELSVGLANSLVGLVIDRDHHEQMEVVRNVLKGPKRIWRSRDIGTCVGG